VEQRVRELGQKSYWEQFEHSPEFAVLFLPGDQFLAAALAERPDLIESALNQRIIVTTPSTLMALLKVIAYGWRQNLVTENAREIRKLGEDLHKRLTTFVSHLQKVSRSLGNAVDSFNASVGSMERNVLPQARKFTELGVAGETLESVDPVEALVRLPAGDAPPSAKEGSADETQN
ncbi:MAG TPA: DNA recombination protein RmuC, partial [Steroidobacteraceae bacterium]